MSKSGKYDDIIDMPHQVSGKRPKMSRSDRAAQFSPFSALVGYDDAVKETERYTDRAIYLDDEKVNEIGKRLSLIKNLGTSGITVRIRYFVPDCKKTGGAYENTEGEIKNIDEIGGYLVMRDGKRIALGAIVDIDGDTFE